VVALDNESTTLRIGTCKRSVEPLVRTLGDYDGHIGRFLAQMGRRFEGWKVEKVAIAPALDAAQRVAIEARGYIPQDLDDLTRGL
jgi:hypothetical protein